MVFSVVEGSAQWMEVDVGGEIQVHWLYFGGGLFVVNEDQLSLWIRVLKRSLRQICSEEYIP